MGWVGWAKVTENLECQAEEFGVREFENFLFQTYCGLIHFYNEQVSHLQ